MGNKHLEVIRIKLYSTIIFTTTYLYFEYQDYEAKLEAQFDNDKDATKPAGVTSRKPRPRASLSLTRHPWVGRDSPDFSPKQAYPAFLSSNAAGSQIIVTELLKYFGFYRLYNQKGRKMNFNPIHFLLNRQSYMIRLFIFQ